MLCSRYEADANPDAIDDGWDDTASSTVHPRFVLTCQALDVFEHYVNHFDQPSLLATSGAIKGQRGRGQLRNHMVALRQIWATTQEIFRHVRHSRAQ
mgnify:CR=1 FL=1